MQYQFSFKHMETSSALQEYAETKISSHISKFVSKPIEAHITFSIDRHEHLAQCTLVGGDGFSLQVEHACDDMYGSVDRMLDKLFVQLKRKKDKLKSHKGNHKIRSVRYKDPDTIDYHGAEIDADDIIKWERKRSFG